MQTNRENGSDCLIIGGGPAGLTAAIYLARFRRSVTVIDEGKSRARYIKHSYNYPGFENGINGNRLLDNLRNQALQFGVRLVEGKVMELSKHKDGIFSAVAGSDVYTAEKVLLATGAVDEKPALPYLEDFIYEGAIRFCPICDGYEALDKRIGIMGPLDHVLPKACFISTYSPDVILLPTDRLPDAETDVRKLLERGVKLPVAKVSGLEIKGEKVEVALENGERIELDVLYPALGTNPRSGLAIKLGAQHNDNECLFGDAHQETTVEGLYVAGDLTTDLSQICVATGQAAIAATDMHNKLAPNPRRDG